MKKQFLLAGVVCCGMALSAAAQQSISAHHEPPQQVLSIPALSNQAAKISEKELELEKSVAVSRAQIARLKEDLQQLNQMYAELLYAEMNRASDPDTRKALETELTYVKSQLAQPAGR